MRGQKKEKQESEDKVQYILEQDREDCQTLHSFSLWKLEQQKKI